ncbi:hypothetical protein BGZ90_010997 [Linnemannia elongata]|nr:hypothetical protein BGZ90_010997 [Linnemannia elongata]
MPTLDHGQHHHQEHYFFLTPTVISYNNEEEDDMSNLDDQFMTLEIGTPEVWPQDPYQAYQPEESMRTPLTAAAASLLIPLEANTATITVAASISTAMVTSTTVMNTTTRSVIRSTSMIPQMTLADYTNASTSTSTGPKL